MSQHTNLGNISLPVGSYEADGKKKKRYRNIGVLMQTANDDGTTRYWIRLNADILHASLYALVRAADMSKGDDTVVAAVFEPREKPQPGGQSAPAAEADADDIPF